MDKTLGELFDELTLLHSKREKVPEDTVLTERLELIYNEVTKQIAYLSNNLELNIMVNMLLRANREYFWAITQIEEFGYDWIENAEDLAAAAVTLHKALIVKEKYIKQINDFMRADI